MVALSVRVELGNASNPDEKVSSLHSSDSTNNGDVGVYKWMQGLRSTFETCVNPKSLPNWDQRWTMQPSKRLDAHVSLLGLDVQCKRIIWPRENDIAVDLQVRND